MRRSAASFLLVPAAVFITVPGAAATYLTPEEAQKVCFPRADRFEDASLIFSPEQKKQIEEATQEKLLAGGLRVWKAYAGKELLGYFILDAVIGKHELIDYAVALDPSGTVLQVEVLTYRESYGGEIRAKG